MKLTYFQFLTKGFSGVLLAILGVAALIALLSFFCTSDAKAQELINQGWSDPRPMSLKVFGFILMVIGVWMIGAYRSWRGKRAQ
jgi:ABC-type Na+ efflux pump permease subunit